jgi:hypothetical protein
MNYRILCEIADDYRPYNTIPAFYLGIADYQTGIFERHYARDLDQQAWDRGLECAMRFERQAHGYEA